MEKKCSRWAHNGDFGNLTDTGFGSPYNILSHSIEVKRMELV